MDSPGNRIAPIRTLAYFRSTIDEILDQPPDPEYIRYIAAKIHAPLARSDPRHPTGRLAGVFFPQPEASLPMDLKRELFSTLSAEVARQIKRRKLSEKEVLEDFASWREERRATRGRR